ncbi:MAG: DUF4097 domain-containing protein [Erysipelotrichaceae bacterium]|jgi:hypothetical protein|nr:DUF4097 domain-containing protein [Erysipelotrichaceae bacterium]
MKKLFVAGMIFVFVGVLSFAACLALGVDLDTARAELSKILTYEYTEEHVDASLQNYSFETKYLVTEVKTEDRDDILIQYHTNNYLHFDFESDDDSFSFKTELESFSLQQISNVFGWLLEPEFYRLKITFPTNFIGKKVSFLQSNGSIELSMFTADEVSVENTNGEITLKDVAIKKLNVNVTNGEITLDNVLSEDARLKTVNGRIDIDKLQDNKRLEIITTNGDLTISESQIQVVTGGTTNGQINLDEFMATVVELRTTNGDIRANFLGEIDDYYLYFKTTNGRVSFNKINHNREYKKNSIDLDHQIILRTTNGSVVVMSYDY